MSGHSPEEVQLEKKRYLTVFYILLVGTVVTVAAYFVELPWQALTVLVALIIASVKGFFVAGYFMHLMDEKKLIYVVMGFTFFFFLGLLLLTIWAWADTPISSW